jgi:hypothetical protein
MVHLEKRLMKTKTVKILECFNLHGMGLVTKLQHYENGIPPNTRLISHRSAQKWIVKKRILSGVLLLNNSEVYFECETKFDHISQIHRTEIEKKNALNKEIEKRKNGIYWYVLEPLNKIQDAKPEINSMLEIE